MREAGAAWSVCCHASVASLLDRSLHSIDRSLARSLPNCARPPATKTLEPAKVSKVCGAVNPSQPSCEPWLYLLQVKLFVSGCGLCKN